MYPFSDTTTYEGHAQRYEVEIGADYGDVTGNTMKMKKFTARMNSAVNKYFEIAVQASGTWELDDFNHDDYHVVYTTLTSGQQDYKFITDEQGNYIRDIYKVLVLPSATATEYQELTGVDENQPENADIINESSAVGTPTKYGKRGNAIHLASVPNYTVTRGIKILINRTSDVFVYTDTTKVVGFPYHQDYFYLSAALDEARVAGLSSFTRLRDLVLKYEGDPLTGKIGLIAKAYGARKKDEDNVISGQCINSV